MKDLKHQRFILTITLVLSLSLHLVYGLEGEKQMSEPQYKIDHQEAIIQDREEQIKIMDMLLDQKVVPELKPKKVYAGEFEITYYTANHESTGKNPGDDAYGITKSGTTVKEGQTIAADWTVLPAGTKIFIEGLGERIVEDTGGLIKGNAIDVYVEDVEVAMELGRHKAKVYVIEEVED